MMERSLVQSPRVWGAPLQMTGLIECVIPAVLELKRGSNEQKQQCWEKGTFSSKLTSFLECAPSL